MTEKYSVLFRGPSLEKRNVPIPISMSTVLLFWHKKKRQLHFCKKYRFFHTSTKYLKNGCCNYCCLFLLIMKSTWSYMNWWIEKKRVIGKHATYVHRWTETTLLHPTLSCRCFLCGVENWKVKKYSYTGR